MAFHRLTYICELGILFLQGRTVKRAVMKREVSTKGQLVIPSKLRRKYGIRKGTQVAFVEGEEHLILQPLTAEVVRGLRGSLKGEPSALRVLQEERKREREP